MFFIDNISRKQYNFYQIVDFLTKDNKDSIIYRGFDRIDILAIISLEKFNIKNKEELKKSRVSYVECLEYLKVIQFFEKA